MAQASRKHRVARFSPQVPTAPKGQIVGQAKLVFNLLQLHQRTIAIELTVQGQKGMFKGIGEYDVNLGVGPALRVKVAHLAGDFEIVLKESQFKGRIESGRRFDCDFALYLQRD